MQQSKLASAFIRFLIVVSLELALQEKPPIDNRRNLLELYIFSGDISQHEGFTNSAAGATNATNADAAHAI